MRNPVAHDGSPFEAGQAASRGIGGSWHECGGMPSIAAYRAPGNLQLPRLVVSAKSGSPGAGQRHHDRSSFTRLLTAPLDRPPDDDSTRGRKSPRTCERDVTTVQRWEKREGMPVNRHVHDRMGSVYAFKSELVAWAQKRRLLVREALEVEPVSTTARRSCPARERDLRRSTAFRIRGATAAARAPDRRLASSATALSRC